ncbi:MAG: M24 family metallopeptidase [Vulcanibacillus sp.]
MNKRLNKLRDEFAKNKIDAMLITSKTNRKYITGFTGSSGYALVTQDKAILITDFRYIEQAKNQVNGFEVIMHQGPINDAVADQIKVNKIDNIGFEQDFVTYSLHKQFANKLSNLNLVPVSHIIENLRMIKDQDEIKLIKKAAEISDQAFTYILNFIKPNMKETDVSIALEYKMRELGADGIAFDSIVVSGYRSSLPHGTPSDKKIQSGDFLTLDFGACYMGYNSDMTRTIVIGKTSSKHKEIYDIVLEAQLEGVKKIKAGMTGKEADALTRDIINKYGYGEYFGHGTGHGLGMDVHEDPRLNHLSETVLTTGMIVTVEPGIYIPDFGGVRIEDDILITESGGEILNRSSKDLISI